MKILALDTSGPAASAALSVDGTLVSEAFRCVGLTHSQTAMPMVDEVLSGAGLAACDVDLFAAVAGPGSFTGVRIGVCAVKGMVHACGKPALALDALETLAMNACGFPGVVCPMLDARRSQVYGAAFRCKRGGLPERLMPDGALPLEAYLDALPKDEPLLFLGDALRVHEKRLLALGERAMLAPEHLRCLRASAACHLAGLRAGEAADGRLLAPIYLRAPQAERERAERSANG